MYCTIHYVDIILEGSVVYKLQTYKQEGVMYPTHAQVVWWTCLLHMLKPVPRVQGILRLQQHIL